MSKISKDYIKSWLSYPFNEKETYRTLLHRGDKFYRGDCIDAFLGFWNLLGYDWIIDILALIGIVTV